MYRSKTGWKCWYFLSDTSSIIYSWNEAYTFTDSSMQHTHPCLLCNSYLPDNILGIFQSRVFLDYWDPDVGSRKLFKMLVRVYQSTCCHTPEDLSLNVLFYFWSLNCCLFRNPSQEKFSEHCHIINYYLTGMDKCYVQYSGCKAVHDILSLERPWIWR